MRKIILTFLLAPLQNAPDSWPGDECDKYLESAAADTTASKNPLVLCQGHSRQRPVFLAQGFLLIALVIPQSVWGAETSDLETELLKLRSQVTYLERTLNLTPASLSAEEHQEIIRTGTTWLINSQEENGHFRYEYEPYEDEYLFDDNIVRQAGALYQLGEVVRRNEDAVPGLGEAIEKSIGYFESLSRADEFLNYEFRCIANTEFSNRCKLGATSLAVIGILSYVEAYPEKADVYAPLIADYMSYIMSAKKHEGGFRNQHIVGRLGQPNKESSFSNGEALLALARYYRLTGDKVAKGYADHAYEYLSEQPYESPLYLWIMAAIKDLHEIDPEDDYVDYAENFTKWRVDRVQTFKGTRKNYCAYAEGIASAESLLNTESLRSEIDFWNARNARLQVTNPYRHQNVDGELVVLETPNFSQATGGFLTSQDVLTQRIDFTQHCISAYLQTVVDIDGETL